MWTLPAFISLINWATCWLEPFLICLVPLVEKASLANAWLIAKTKSWAFLSCKPETKTPLLPAAFNCCATLVTSASNSLSYEVATAAPVITLYNFTNACFWFATDIGKRLSADAPDNVMFASNW